MFKDELNFSELTASEIIAMIDLNKEKGTSPRWIVRLFNIFCEDTRDGAHCIYPNDESTKILFRFFHVLKEYVYTDHFLTLYADGSDTVVESIPTIWNVIQGKLKEEFKEWIKDYFKE